MAWYKSVTFHATEPCRYCTSICSHQATPGNTANGVGSTKQGTFRWSYTRQTGLLLQQDSGLAQFRLLDSYHSLNFHWEHTYSAIMARTFASSSPSPPVFPYMVALDSRTFSIQQLSPSLVAILLVVVVLYWFLPSHSNLKHVPLLKSSNGFSLMNVASKVIHIPVRAPTDSERASIIAN